MSFDKLKLGPKFVELDVGTYIFTFQEFGQVPPYLQRKLKKLEQVRAQTKMDEASAREKENQKVYLLKGGVRILRNDITERYELLFL